MLVTPVGITRLLKEEQPRNALFPMLEHYQEEQDYSKKSNHKKHNSQC